MLVEDSTELPDFEPVDPFAVRPLTSLREVQVYEKFWRYKWDGEVVSIYDPDLECVEVATWDVLEITKSEYRAWLADDDGGLVVTSKDVCDYIKEYILRKQMARKIAGKFSKAA